MNCGGQIYIAYHCILIFIVLMTRHGISGNPRATRSVSTQFNGVIHSQITIQCIGTLPGDTLDTVITPIIVQNENIGSIVWWKGSNLVEMSNTTKYSGGTLANPALTIMDLIDSDESGYECTCSANSFNPIPLRVVIVNYYGDSGDSNAAIGYGIGGVGGIFVAVAMIIVGYLKYKGKIFTNPPQNTGKK